MNAVGSPTAYRASRILSWVALAAAAASSIVGLAVPDVYSDPTAWATEALRGGDLATLLVMVPGLAVSIVLAGRGSVRARLAWLGFLAYGVYNFAFYAFGADFSDVFLLHVLGLASSLYALITTLLTTDVRGIGERFSPHTPARLVGGFLVLVACIFAGLWITFSVRFAVTGSLRLGAAPLDGVQLVFALDLTLLAPSLAIAGVALWRRRPAGFVLATALAIFGAVYQVNLALAGVFQSLGDVPDVALIDPVGLSVLALFVLASYVMLRNAPASAPSDR